MNTADLSVEDKARLQTVVDGTYWMRQGAGVWLRRMCNFGLVKRQAPCEANAWSETFVLTDAGRARLESKKCTTCLHDRRTVDDTGRCKRCRREEESAVDPSLKTASLETETYFLIGDSDIVLLERAAKRLFTETRMNGDEMRSLAQVLARVVRHAREIPLTEDVP